MKAIATLRYLAENKPEITIENLELLGFEKVLEGRYKLSELVPNRADDYSTRIYVNINDENISIEAANLYGDVRIGNNYIGWNPTFKELLMIVEMLKA